MCCLAVKVKVCQWKAPEQAVDLYCVDKPRTPWKPFSPPSPISSPLPKLRTISGTLKDLSLLFLLSCILGPLRWIKMFTFWWNLTCYSQSAGHCLCPATGHWLFLTHKSLWLTLSDISEQCWGSSWCGLEYLLSLCFRDQCLIVIADPSWP